MLCVLYISEKKISAPFCFKNLLFVFIVPSSGYFVLLQKMQIFRTGFVLKGETSQFYDPHHRQPRQVLKNLSS